MQAQTAASCRLDQASQGGRVQARQPSDDVHPELRIACLHLALCVLCQSGEQRGPSPPQLDNRRLQVAIQRAAFEQRVQGGLLDGRAAQVVERLRAHEVATQALRADDVAQAQGRKHRLEKLPT